uniref:Phorbol-ester/DAG-type domain-containing protein n=1 Tax=Ditylenchus dipsaci TaxID=166011 RepID=A0A915D895_9BILA
MQTKIYERSLPKIPKRITNSVIFNRYDHWITASESSLQCGVCEKKDYEEMEKCDVCLHDKCFKEFHINY